jgi:hypothetical protein
MYCSCYSTHLILYCLLLGKKEVFKIQAQAWSKTGERKVKEYILTSDSVLTTYQLED